MNEKRLICLVLAFAFLCVSLAGCGKSDSLTIGTDVKERITDNPNDTVYKVYYGQAMSSFFQLIYHGYCELEDLNDPPYIFAVLGYYYEVYSENGEHKLTHNPDFDNGTYQCNMFAIEKMRYVYYYVENPQLVFSPSVKIKNTYLMTDQQTPYSYACFVTNVGTYLLVVRKKDGELIPYLMELDVYCEYCDKGIGLMTDHLLTEPFQP